MTRSDLQQLADLRIAEASALLSLTPPCPSGAYYLAGYAVECALKACIAKGVNQHDFPDKELAIASYTHEVEKLLKVAELKRELENYADANPLFKLQWGVVKDWTEASRYRQHSVAAAQKLVDAVNGVLPWIKAHW
jgi:hypothetical protein